MADATATGRCRRLLFIPPPPPPLELTMPCGSCSPYLNGFSPDDTGRLSDAVAAGTLLVVLGSGPLRPAGAGADAASAPEPGPDTAAWWILACPHCGELTRLGRTGGQPATYVPYVLSRTRPEDDAVADALTQLLPEALWPEQIAHSRRRGWRWNSGFSLPRPEPRRD
jgi:hypothetical protein